MSPDLSVIVPVRNGGDDLRRLLTRLSRQTIERDRFEVVIADDGSTDGSAVELSDGDWVRVLPGPPRNSYAARNRAVQASLAPILAFCDADCLPEPDWLEQGIAALDGTDVAAGRVRFLPPARRNIWALIDMDMSKDQEMLVRNRTAETANLFLRRELYDRVDGFDDTISEHGDFDFVERCVAAGASLAYAPAAVAWHPVRTRARPLFRAIWIYTRGYAERSARDGVLPQGLRLRAWIPILPTLRSRRRWGRSLGPDRRWLGVNGVVPRPYETVLALPIMYVFVPYLRGFAQLRGWWDGRSRRRRLATAPAP
jgi:glycosyltransferase involved in cell wall biosynthesis